MYGVNKKQSNLWERYKSHVQKVILNEEIENAENVSYWRNAVFCKILTYLTPLSIIALIPSVIISFMNGFAVVGIADLLTFFILVIITVSARIKIELRKAIVIFLLYCLSLILLYYLPQPGPGLLFLLTITIFSSLIYSSSAGYFSAVLNTVIILSLALLIYSEIESQFVFAGNLGAWLAVSSNLIFLSFACTKCLDLLLGGLTDSLKENRISKEKLEKANQLYQFISQINQTIVHVKDMETLFNKSCSIALEFGKYKIAWIGKFDIEHKKIDILNSCGVSETYVKHFADLPYQKNSPHDQVWQTGEYFLCNDIQNGRELENWKPYADKLEVRSCIVLPIYKSGLIFGTFNLYSSEINFFEAEDIALLKEVTGDISFALDIFERAEKHQKAEENLKINYSKLELATKEQSAILNTLPASIALLDNHGDIVKVNDEWIQFGETNGQKPSYQHLKQNYIEIAKNSLGKEAIDGIKMSEGITEILNGEKDHFSLEYSCDSPTEKRWFKGEVRPIKSSILPGAVVMHMNISDRKLTELERSKITHDLLQRNRDLEQFTFIISHNLRAPTANIIGFTEYLQDETLTNEERNVLLESLGSSVKGLDTIIKDINSILQVKREINEKKETIFFSKLVSDIINSDWITMDKHDVQIKTDFSEIDEIFSLKVFLHSIFFNLINNSIKYRKPNESPLIEISSKKENEKIILTFKDNGLGIDLKSKGDKVFGLYNRFHNHVEGKGMGLFMVKTQVDAIGGKISLISELNKGTEFTIELNH